MLKDIFTKKENQIMLGVVCVSVILICFGFYFLFKDADNNGPRKIPNTIDEIVWKQLESKEYNFTLEYPEHFVVSQDDKNFGPVFNFYFELKDSKPPITHLANESQMSVYPTGIPSGGDPSFASKDFDYKNKNGVDLKLKEFKTYSGKTWGIMATPVSTPKNWKPWGFVWISSRISELTFRCFDGKAEISENLCNPLEGDQYYKEGNIDENFIKTGREFLDKINFN